MTDCCSNAAGELDKLVDRQRTTLVLVLCINAVLFVVEAGAGLMAGSAALVSDALDMLGDALIYGFSLYVVALGALWKVRAAMVKGWVMLGFGLGVLALAVYRMLAGDLPHHPTMGVAGALALVGNASCLGLLWRHRADDINMKSVWLCSRNDIIANLSVLGAAAGVWALQSKWPDFLVGVAIAILFMRSATTVLLESYAQRRAIAAHDAAHDAAHNAAHDERSAKLESAAVLR